ncbi:iron-containing alcohol dehydrogenase [Paenibacillus arenilitoris]|uniref:Iron-containing alcohol dehydrogenase n=1 Tax=Paenibacillus arenilitoris TaxID=2772299 RepID=A0A927CLR5_9BACL|nr:iron-containing alcohol dehydrogenase [Paenibacillus arenilitoris]MBD2868506.1 iron-containing alcohol dehydrogenase [Paenibacillus arenilitoris]
MSEPTGNYQFQTAGKIIAGPHAIQRLGHALTGAGQASRALIVASDTMRKRGVTDEIAALLAQRGIASEAIGGVMREPTADHIEQLADRVGKEHFDVYIGIGGGSVLDATKLLSVLRTNRLGVREMIGTELITGEGIPTVLIPTTSGTGSEATPNAIVTLAEEKLKIGIVSRHLLPRLVVLDPVLTLGLPKPITAATGMDAFTHALESYISNKANPISDMLALESIRLISRSIVPAFHNGSSLEDRSAMLLGSMLGGMALAGSGTAAVHAMAYPLGGRFNIPHGAANAMLLPHVMAFNLDRIRDKLEIVAAAMGIAKEPGRPAAAAERVIERIAEWTEELEIPQDLTAYGVQAADIPSLSAAAFNVRRLMDNNPKPVSTGQIEAVYRKLLPREAIK